MFNGTFKERLLPLVKDQGKGKLRLWSFDNCIETLKQLNQNKVDVAGVQLWKISQPTSEQKKIMDLLGVKL